MMPLFRSKFQPKKSPPRKAGTVSNLQRSLDAAQIEQEFAIQFDQIKLDLGGQHQFVFDSRGQWLATGRNRSRSNSANSSSSHNVDRLAGQNQMLHIQVELLLNMVKLMSHYMSVVSS